MNSVLLTREAAIAAGTPPENHSISLQGRERGRGREGGEWRREDIEKGKEVEKGEERGEKVSRREGRRR